MSTRRISSGQWTTPPPNGNGSADHLAEPCLNISQVAEFLQVSQKTVRRLICDGMIRSFRVGTGSRSHIRFEVADVRSFIKRQKQESQ